MNINLMENNNSSGIGEASKGIKPVLFDLGLIGLSTFVYHDTYREVINVISNSGKFSITPHKCLALSVLSILIVYLVKDITKFANEKDKIKGKHISYKRCK